MTGVTVVGATTWGTTLAVLLARKGVPVTLMARSPEEAAELASSRRNARFLPSVEFPPPLTVAGGPQEALSGASMVILAVPSTAMRRNVLSIGDAIRGEPVILSASKGLEMESGKRMSQVLEELLPQRLRPRISVLSGPNLALEVVEGKPASTVVASRLPEAAARAQELLMSGTFRVYTNQDTVGVELGGALKNIIALGAGICDGLGYGDNGKAAFMTRGLAEITRLGVAAGANPITFAGLAGLGDLVATCASPLSRNHQVGSMLAAGRSLEQIRTSMENVAEGVFTTAAAVKLADDMAVEMPIANATYRVLFEGMDPKRAVAELMGRPPRAE
ncbi:MAG: NAD(P)-dependent glycerol-3-phosphate dehydrogenase [Dehalococcoidia bacterium]|nr:NAD(P)-dependent glycerol-3-phosphate dehydrogenase [Dehalococcoidia bacterium]